MPSDTYTLTISDAGVSIPSAHASTHLTGGSDAIPVASTSTSGLMSPAIYDQHVVNTAKVSNVTHTVDVTDVGGVLTVGKINNVTLSTLGTGILRMVNGTPMLALAEHFPTLNQSTTGNANTATTATNIVGGSAGSIPYQSGSGATTMLDAGTSGYVLKSNGSGLAPSWTAFDFSSLAGTLPANKGGTGQSSYAVGDLLYANTTTTIGKLTDIATGNVLLSGGTNAAPSYGKVGLTTHVTGILPVANGGTGYGSDGIGTLSFDTTPDTGTALTEGQLRWNATDKTLDLKMTGAAVTQQVGQELLMRVHASTAITNGDVVYISGSNSGLPAISKASSSSLDSRKTLAVATEDISAGSDGYVTLYGLVRGLNLSAYTAGQELWLSTTAGAFVGVEPSFPDYKVRIGYVITPTNGAGVAYVSPRFYENGTVNGTGKIGYLTGSGGAVTQLTSKSTNVTLNKTNGQITMNNATLNFDTVVSFTLINSKIEAGDVLVLNHIGGGTAGVYLLNAQCANGSAIINVKNTYASAGAGSVNNLSEAIVIAFAVIKAVNA